MVETSLLDEVLALEAGNGAPTGLQEQIGAAQSARESGVHAVDPREGAIATRESNMAGQVGQEYLGEPGLPDAGLRADLSFSSRFDEKKLKFMDAYPEGDMVQVIDPGALGRPGGLQILFRRSPNEPYAKIDADAMEKFEFIGDISDISGDVPAMALEALLTRGARLWKQAVGAFLGGTIGEGLKEAIEYFRGYQRESVPEIATRAVQQGLMASAGAITTVGVSGPLNWVRGAPSIAVVPGAQRAQMAAARLGIPRLTAGQVASSPLWRRVSGQSAATVKNIGDYVREQNGAAARAFRNLRDEDVSRVLAGDLAKLHDDARQQIVKAAMLSGPTDLSMGGSAIQAGLAEYDDLARTLVNRLYAEARQIETPEFDVSALKASAADIAARAAALGEKVPPAIQDAMARINEFDAALPAVTLRDGSIIDATERLKAIRTSLWEMSHSPPGALLTPEQRAIERQAGQLYGAVTKVMEDPKNVSPEFRAAWSKAATEAKMRFDTMEKLLVIRAAKSETPAKLAESLGKPHQVDNLRLLKEVLPEQRWDEFRYAVMSDWTEGAKVNGLTKRLQSFDQATLNTMFNRAEIGVMDGIGRNFDKLNALGLPQILERQSRRGNIAYEILTGNERSQIETFNKMIGTNVSVRKEVRAGLIDALLSRHIDNVEGVPTIGWKGLNSDLDKMLGNGALRFLTANDVRILRDLKLVGEFLPDASDAGTSIVAATTAGKATKDHTGFILDILRQSSIGRLMTTNTMQRILLGSDRATRRPLSFDSLRAAGAIAAELVNDVEGGIAPNEEASRLPALTNEAVGKTAEGRTLYRNADGSVSSERSITVTDPRINGGKPTNIPSMFGGKQLDEDAAVEMIQKAGGKDPETGRALPAFESIEEAVAAAKKRSKGLVP